ncbi:MAG: hypothetical protein D3910_17600 [Candidatus Electrothrix sp. ATG2]|nr:hypothetical protein [Candidatus Electrothrix sp. ATG2]
MSLANLCTVRVRRFLIRLLDELYFGNIAEMAVKEEKIFTPFYSDREDSAGLGLAIVQQFVEQQAGTVRLLEPEEGCSLY